MLRIYTNFGTPAEKEILAVVKLKTEKQVIHVATIEI
jgi:hypothetical protein